MEYIDVRHFCMCMEGEESWKHKDMKRKREPDIKKNLERREDNEIKMEYREQKVKEIDHHKESGIGSWVQTWQKRESERELAF